MKKITNQMLLLIMVICLPAMLLAQRTITGTVTDAETGEALIAANVVVVGTTTGTTTDLRGNYSIALPDGATKLVFSYAGYTKQELEVGASNVLDVKMTAGEDLDELLVIGYGEVKKEDATGAIQSVSEKDFNKGAITSVQDLVAGKIAGVSITPSTDPGGGAGITVRGLSSLDASNSPLIVIDGVPVDGNNNGGSRNFLNIVNPNDIASVTVLKDASAAAIYGSRASGGVIIITTKKGKGSDKFSLAYNGNISSSSVTNQMPVLSATDFRALVIDRFGENSSEAALMGEASTNWQDEIYQNAIGTDHNINFSGGVKGLPYRASVGYTNKNGVLKTDRFQRTTLALNVNPSFLDNTLQVNFGVKTMFSQNQFADRGAIGTSVNFDPTQPVLSSDQVHQDGYAGYFAYVDGQGNPLGLAPTNPMALLNLKDDGSNVSKYILNGSVDYRMPFLPDLRAHLNLGYERFYGEGQVVVDPQMAYAVNDTGSIADYWNKNTNELLEFYLNYTKDFGKVGNLDIMGGYSWQHFFWDGYSYSRNTSGFRVYSPEETYPRENYLISLYGRVNYSVENLLLTFTLRRDGSSRFSEQARWGLFPSAAAAYKIIDNKDGFVNHLKVRIGYGVTGQQDLGNGFRDLYPYLPLYDLSQDNARYQFGNNFYNTYRPRGYDASLKWEETASYNFAVDFTLLDDRVSGSVDIYQKYTKDLLGEVTVAAGSNLTNRIITNVGNMENNGVEINLNATPIKKDKFTWEIGGNATYEQNKITKLQAIVDTTYLGRPTGNISGGIGNTIMIHSIGYPLASFFVYEQEYDSEGNPIEGQYADLDGNGTGGQGNSDRYRFNNPNPNWFFGINTRVAYGAFEVSASARAKVGNYIYNNVLSTLANYNQLKGNTPFLNNVHEQTTVTNFETAQLLSDYYVTNGSFLRLDYVTLTYTLPEIKGINNLRVFGTVQNPLLITNYTGLDPEVGGIDGNVYPRSRTILFGVSGNF